MKHVTSIYLLCLAAVSANGQIEAAKNRADSTETIFANEILKAWQKHDSFNQLILESLNDEYLSDYSASKGRTVGEQFAHMHQTRVNWLVEIAPDVAKALLQRPSDWKSTKALKGDLAASCDAIYQVLKSSMAQGNTNGHPIRPINLLCYLISHESHHRGQILLSLKQSGHAAKPQISYGIWNWFE